MCLKLFEVEETHFGSSSEVGKAMFPLTGQGGLWLAGHINFVALFLIAVNHQILRIAALLPGCRQMQ